MNSVSSALDETDRKKKRKKTEILRATSMFTLTFTVCPSDLHSPYDVRHFGPILFTQNNHILASIQIVGQSCPMV